MTKINIYTNKGSRAKDAIGFAIYCLEKNIDVMNISDEEYARHKMEYDKEHYVANGWHPTEKDLDEKTKTTT